MSVHEVYVVDICRETGVQDIIEHTNCIHYTINCIHKYHKKWAVSLLCKRVLFDL